MYSYQYRKADNPFYHVEYTIPSVEQEINHPGLSRSDRLGFWAGRIKEPKTREPVGSVIRVFTDMVKLGKALDEYRALPKFVPCDPYPSIEDLSNDVKIPTNSKD